MRYIAPLVSPLPITSDNEICYWCFQDIKFLTLKQWSLKHYWKYKGHILRFHYNQVKMFITNKLKHDTTKHEEAR